MGMQANIPYMDPIQCTPSALNSYGGRVPELTFESSPGCTPDPEPEHGDYYQIDPLDGDGTVCGHVLNAGDYLVWDANSGTWQPMTPAGASEVTRIMGVTFDSWANLVAYTGYEVNDVIHIRVSGEPMYHYRAVTDTGQPNDGNGGAYIWPADKATSGLVWEQI